MKRLTREINIPYPCAGTGKYSHRTVGDSTRMAKVKVMQMPPESADGLDRPVGQENAFGQYKVPNFWGMRNYSFNSIIRDEGTSCEI